MSSSVADLAALGKLLEEHRGRLLAMIERRLDPALRARVSPEDIFQEASLVAQRHYARFKADGQMTPYAWLYRLALDALLEAWRRHSRSPRDVVRDVPLPEQSSIQLGLGLVHTGTSPSSAVAREELRQRVRQVVELLKEKDRQLLSMRHQDGLAHQEIAQVLGVSENAAMVRYTRALKRFKDLWQHLHPELGASG
jgi:RNA polymerase sigma-70 factor (ECF subfamily)